MPIHNATFVDQAGNSPPASGLELVGPTIQVLVGVAPLAGEAVSLKIEGGREVLALIDTGASTSCISDPLAQELGLTPIDRQEMMGVGGPKEHLLYLGMISVPQLGTVSKGRFVGVDMGESQPIILGRDFLRGCVLIYHGPAGTITICR